MFKLLLDEHLYPGIPQQVKTKLKDAQIEALQSWENGRLMQQSDSRILLEARKEGWTLLTYDLATIPPLIAEMNRVGEDHAGVIFVSHKSFAQNDHGGLVKALVSTWADWSETDWINRVEFLQKS